MYSFNGSTRRVGETPHYGYGEIEAERFPAELALRDLKGHHGQRSTPLIVARYSALRAWWLVAASAEDGLRDHAIGAAKGYIAALAEDAPERPLLDRLLEPLAGEDAGAALQAIAVAAESAGHIDGALAAHIAAWTAEVRALRLPEAARVADETAGFLRRWGGTAAAADWDRTARRLRRAASAWDSPSSS